MPDVERVLEQLYSDAAMREDLRDSEAETLLRWAETQVERLAAEAPDDATFEAQAEQLRTLLKGVNHVVGARAALDEAALQTSMNRLSAEAQALGAPPSFSSQAAPDLKALDDAAALQTVLASLNLDAAAQLEAPASSDSEAEPADAPTAFVASAENAEAPASADSPDAITEHSDAPAPLYPGRTPLTLWPRRPAGEPDSHDETPDIEDDKD